ncbi:unnamed protein product [Leptidea sinapis]|uniref:Uncharacterized protein n=1 Tax=Leptidea sinapis TaxID=189913 RepID=A0A5E4QTU0_9NEOP|nr:unnamed protein product [Leptidea sinapis]
MEQHARGSRLLSNKKHLKFPVKGSETPGSIKDNKKHLKFPVKGSETPGSIKDISGTETSPAIAFLRMCRITLGGAIFIAGSGYIRRASETGSDQAALHGTERSQSRSERPSRQSRPRFERVFGQSPFDVRTV